MTWADNQAVGIALGNPGGVTLTVNGRPKGSAPCCRDIELQPLAFRVGWLFLAGIVLPYGACVPRPVEGATSTLPTPGPPRRLTIEATLNLPSSATAIR
jgi:hypothetical protein